MSSMTKTTIFYHPLFCLLCEIIYLCLLFVHLFCIHRRLSLSMGPLLLCHFPLSLAVIPYPDTKIYPTRFLWNNSSTVNLIQDFSVLSRVREVHRPLLTRSVPLLVYGSQTPPLSRPYRLSVVPRVLFCYLFFLSLFFASTPGTSRNYSWYFQDRE